MIACAEVCPSGAIVIPIRLISSRFYCDSYLFISASDGYPDKAVGIYCSTTQVCLSDTQAV